jgi:hypothetical protein
MAAVWRRGRRVLCRITAESRRNRTEDESYNTVLILLLSSFQTLSEVTLSLRSYLSRSPRRVRANHGMPSSSYNVSTCMRMHTLYKLEHDIASFKFKHRIDYVTLFHQLISSNDY